MRSAKKQNMSFGYILFRAARFLLLLWLGIWVWGWVSANRMAFLPPPPSYTADEPDLVFVSVEGDERVAVMFLEYPGSERVVLFAHGNGEDIGQLRSYLEMYRKEFGITLAAVDYRGYGQSDGRPGLSRANADVRAVYHDLLERGFAAENIVLHGRSLGTAMVLALAAEERVGGVILESAILSGFQAVIPWRLFPNDPIPNRSRIERVSAPVHFIHGLDDRVLPVWHGKTLYRLAPEPKSADWLEGVGHNDILFAGGAYWDSLERFLVVEEE